MYAVGMVVLVVLAGYFLFTAIDTFGLTSRVAPALVVGTSYRAAGKTYITQIVNNRPVVLPQTVPEVYLVDLEIDGRVVTAAVDKEMHDGLRAGQGVEATVSRTRLTGRVGVLEVRPTAGGAARPNPDRDIRRP
jgi:hypothetical protein